MCTAPLLLFVFDTVICCIIQSTVRVHSQSTVQSSNYVFYLEDWSGESTDNNCKSCEYAESEKNKSLNAVLGHKKVQY